MESALVSPMDDLRRAMDRGSDYNLLSKSLLLFLAISAAFYTIDPSVLFSGGLVLTV